MSDRPTNVKPEDLTPQQFDIYQAAVNLQSFLEENVAPTTSHYAVEDTGRALRVLINQSTKQPIITHDAK